VYRLHVYLYEYLDNTVHQSDRSSRVKSSLLGCAAPHRTTGMPSFQGLPRTCPTSPRELRVNAVAVGRSSVQLARPAQVVVIVMEAQ